MFLDDRELAAFAKPRHNALSYHELAKVLGMSRGAMKRRCDHGSLHRVGPEAYVYGSGALSFHGRARIGSILGGPGSGAHNEATLALLGIIRYEPTVIDVLTSLRRDPRTGYRFVRTSLLDPCAGMEIDYVPSVAVEIALRGLAATRHARRLGKLLRDAQFHGKLNVPLMREVVSRFRHAPGHANMVAAMAAFDVGGAGAWSGLEEIGWKALHDVMPDEAPIQNEELILGTKVVVPDLRWRDSGVSVEFDGGPHDFASARIDDADKDRLYRAIGDAVLRVNEFDLRFRVDEVRADLRGIILERRRLRTGSGMDLARAETVYSPWRGA